MKTVKKNSSVHLLRAIGLWVLYGALSLYLLANIVLSQLISPLYFTFIKQEQQAVVPFLVAVKPLPLFKDKLLLYKDLYGVGIEDAVFNEELRKNTLINNFEQILSINPSARNILYNLFLLYKARGDENRAGKYLQKATQIDPSLNKK